MTIRVLKNFGLNGENLAKGQEIVVDPTHFGDNIETFRTEGYFEEVTEAPAAPEAAAPAAESKPAPVKKDEPDESGFQGLNKNPLNIKKPE